MGPEKYLGLLPGAVDAGRQLHGGQRLQVVSGRVGDVGDHGGLAVNVSQRFTEQHGELTVPE